MDTYRYISYFVRQNREKFVKINRILSIEIYID